MITGTKRRTLEKAEAVVAAAEAEPEKYGNLVADMDRTGRVNGPYQRLRIKKQAEQIRKQPPPLPMDGPYRCVVIDFPWPHEPGMSQEDLDERGRSLRPYPPMSIAAGRKFFAESIKPILAPDCVVWMWVTNFHLRYAIDLLDQLGVKQHSTMCTWFKERIGHGWVVRDQTEHCIIARIGNPIIELTNETTGWYGWKQPRENSRKPDEFYALVERLCPAPRYAELFSRGGRGPKWDAHGDQVGKFATSDVNAAMAELIEESLRKEPSAPIGEIPTCNQRGMFRLDVDGVPYLIAIRELLEAGAYAVDPWLPCISETGYHGLSDVRRELGEAMDAWALRAIREERDAPLNWDTGKREPRSDSNPLPLPEYVYLLPQSWEEAEDGGPIAVDANVSRAVNANPPAADGLDVPELTRRHEGEAA